MRLPLATPILTRDGSLAKDGKMVNVYLEPQPDGSRDVVKRPGTTLAYSLPAGVGQGMFSYAGLPYAIIGDTVYHLTGAFSVALPGVGSSNLRMWTLDSNTLPVAPDLAIIKSTERLWVVSSVTPTITRVTDADYPSDTVPGIAYLEGTYYVLTEAGRLYGSDLEDPTSWNALNFLQIDRGLGAAVAITRHLNYVLALCDSGLQLFYDAANPGPGSPLSPLSNTSYLIGCASADSVARVEDKTIFMARDSSRGRSVMSLTGLSLEVLSTPFIDKILGVASLSTVYSIDLKISGHSFYLLTLPDLNVTLVYDLILREWYVWASGATGASYFNAVFHLAPPNVDSAFHDDYFLNASSGKVYGLVTTAYADYETAIYCWIRTVIYDFNTMDRKPLSRINLVGDTVASTIALTYSDDDYATSSSSRNIDLSTKRKLLTRLGTFRRRSFDLIHTAATALRLRWMEFHSDDKS